MDFLERSDPDGSLSAFESDTPAELEDHYRLVAETVSLGIERGDPIVLKAVLGSLLVRPSLAPWLASSS